MAQDMENESILVKILKTEGLDIRDKISGVIGKLPQTYIVIHILTFNMKYDILPKISCVYY